MYSTGHDPMLKSKGFNRTHGACQLIHYGIRKGYYRRKKSGVYLCTYLLFTYKFTYIPMRIYWLFNWKLKSDKLSWNFFSIVKLSKSGSESKGFASYFNYLADIMLTWFYVGRFLTQKRKKNVLSKYSIFILFKIGNSPFGINILLKSNNWDRIQNHSILRIFLFSVWKSMKSFILCQKKNAQTMTFIA